MQDLKSIFLKHSGTIWKQRNKSNRGLTNASKEKAETWNNQFKPVFTKADPNSQIPPLTKRTTSSISKLDRTSEGVSKLLKNINLSKAMEPDWIPNTVIKKTVQKNSHLVSLTFFKNQLTPASFPEDWPSAEKAPVFKKGDVHAAENYRPVSHTCVSCKLLKHCL